MEMSALCLDDVEYELTNECCMTINALAVGTTYQIGVAAVTARAKGPLASIQVKTDSAGKDFEILVELDRSNHPFRRFYTSSSDLFRDRST